MRKVRHLWLSAALLGAAALLPYSAGCSSEEQAAIDEEDEGELPGPSRGSAIVLSADDRVAVTVNRDVGTVSVFSLSYQREGYSRDGKDTYLPVVTKKAEIDVGKGSEPWQAVISPNGNKAYVVLRKSQEVVRITGLRDWPHEDGRAKVGSEPTGIAMTPSGKRLFVANWVDGTLSEVDARNMKVKGEVDLNAALASTKLLGDVAARPALAHPRSVAVTSNLDGRDDDESILVTEYFAQRTAPLAPDGSNADTSLQGVVYKVNVGDKSVQVIPLAPLADMGFKDQANGTAGCFPNQLQSVTIAGPYAYVSSVCASPKGPIGVFTGPANKVCAADSECPGGAAGTCSAAKKCTTNCTADAECGANGGKCVANVCAPNVASVKSAHAPVVSVIDIAKGTELKDATASLNAKFDGLYASKNQPDDGTRRFPHMPADIAFVPKPIFKNGHGRPIDETPGGAAYVAANAADGVFRVQYDLSANSNLVSVGSTEQNFIDLNPAGIAPDASGKNPIGIAIGYTGRNFALVANDVTRNVSVIDLRSQTIAKEGDKAQVISSAALPAKGTAEDKALKGKRFFNTATGRWSLKGQGWGSCQTCHTDGLTDNVTWFFARGPRQSTSLDGSFSKKNPKDQRIFNWTAIFDEVDDFELNTRGVSGGVGAIVKATSAPPVAADRIDIAALGHAGLSGSAAQAADPKNPANLTTPGLLTDWEDITEYMRGIRPPRGATKLDPYKVEQGKKVFEEANCQGCHGGDKWTISTLFYQPSQATTTALATKPWTAPEGFPASLLPATAQNAFMRFPSNNGGLDQIQCILRPVGTFNASDGKAGASELRADMKTKAQGDETDGKGFNPPSLFGAATGAPYLHNGGALTLESLLSSQFKSHHGALAPGFLDEYDAQRTQKIEWLVQYILSIDAEQQAFPIPQAGAKGGDFCQGP
jgi:DNA-binding beta-propeller fold protein YncE/mono/diheme cytochrome c family protein